MITTVCKISVHDYLGIDLGEVWAVIERDLPTLKKQIRQMVKPLTKRPPKG
ncbi:MAG: HepT-like ribonuclease domain-containing protein [Nitrospirota bacterium]